MKSLRISVSILVCCLLSLCVMLPCRAAACTDAANAILAAELQEANAASVQEWVADTLPALAGSGGADWYIMALSQSAESFDASAYENALRAIIAQGSGNATARQRTALALLAIEPDASGSLGALLTETLGTQGIMSLIFGLHLQNNNVSCDISTEQTIDDLLALQLADGGWALSGTRSDVDVTAMTIQALAPHIHIDQVHTAIENALVMLSSAQLADGGFQSYGISNLESAAQVWCALSALGIDALTDERFIKDATIYDAILAFQCDAGRYTHLLGGDANAMASVQAFVAYTAYARFLAGKGSFYLFSTRVQAPPDGAMTTAGSATSTAIFSTSVVSFASSSVADASDPSPKAFPVKWLLTAGIIVIAAVVALYCVKSGRRHRNHYLLIGIIAAIGIIAVHCIRIQSPDDYYADSSDAADAVGMVTFSIRCDLLPDNHTHDHLPTDGWISPAAAYPIYEGETVLTLLRRICREQHIQIESDGASDALAYIRGIDNLYELEFGDLSGWVYLVNAESPAVGCGQCSLTNGDVVEWVYTLELGNDIP